MLRNDLFTLLLLPFISEEKVRKIKLKKKNSRDLARKMCHSYIETSKVLSARKYRIFNVFFFLKFPLKIRMNELFLPVFLLCRRASYSLPPHWFRSSVHSYFSFFLFSLLLSFLTKIHIFIRVCFHRRKTFYPFRYSCESRNIYPISTCSFYDWLNFVPSLSLILFIQCYLYTPHDSKICAKLSRSLTLLIPRDALSYFP